MQDEQAWRAANHAGRNWWPAYYPEILARMGLPHDVIGPEHLSAEGLAGYDVLLLPGNGGRAGKPAPPDGNGSPEAIADWVEAGGLLIGFATEGLDDLFGIEVENTLPHMGDEFTPSGCIRLCDAERTLQLLPPHEQHSALPVIAPLRVAEAPECRELARLLSFFEQDLHRPAIAWREVGEGAACWWAFDLAECLWKMHQGRPVYEDFDGDGKLRTMDAVVTRPWPAEIPYADLMLMVLRRIIAERGAVFLSQLPPCEDGSIPDALFHWGGDDEADPDVSVPAAEFMADLGLPYHINIMPNPPGTHPLPREDFERLGELGCERSIHFNFITHTEHPFAFTKADLARQLEDYLAAYGEMPVCTVFHWVSWTGWAEPARWLAELGLRGDNNRIHWRYPPVNPTNRVAFAFGTAWPFYYLDDWRHKNARIDFVSLPICGYEVGHFGGEFQPSQLHRAIELAGRWGLTMSLFYHPVRLTEDAPRQAVREALRQIDRLGLTALHMGTDALCEWWHERDCSVIECVETDEREMSVSISAESERGAVLEMLTAEDTPPEVTVGSASATCRIVERCGDRWLLVAVPRGRSEVRVKWR